MTPQPANVNNETAAAESRIWLDWLETPEGRQWAAGFDYFLFILNDSRDEAERHAARESLQRMLAVGPQGRFTNAMSETYIYMAEQRIL